MTGIRWSDNEKGYGFLYTEREGERFQICIGLTKIEQEEAIKEFEEKGVLRGACVNSWSFVNPWSLDIEIKPLIVIPIESHGKYDNLGRVEEIRREEERNRLNNTDNVNSINYSNTTAP